MKNLHDIDCAGSDFKEEKRNEADRNDGGRAWTVELSSLQQVTRLRLGLRLGLGLKSHAAGSRSGRRQAGRCWWTLEREGRGVAITVT